MNQLINFWEEFDSNVYPFVHPKDSFLKSEDCCLLDNYQDYIFNSDFWKNEGKLHTKILPIPFAGNLKYAKIFILLLNPGLSLTDYYSEQTLPEFRGELKNNIKQENLNAEYPFLFLNPKYLWQAGGQYWLKKFKGYILEVSERKQISYAAALSYVAQRVAMLELIPYHSNNFKNDKLIGKLQSAIQIRNFVHRYIIPKIEANECCIVCTRKIKSWNLPNHENIIQYKGAESRSAHLYKNKSAHTTIQKFLID